jgi:hypothetical protein
MGCKGWWRSQKSKIRKGKAAEEEESERERRERKTYKTEFRESFVDVFASLFLEDALKEVDVGEDVRERVLVEHVHARARDQLL